MNLDKFISTFAIIGILGLGALFLYKGLHQEKPPVAPIPPIIRHVPVAPDVTVPVEIPVPVLSVKSWKPKSFCWSNRSSFWPLRDILAAPSQGWDPCFGYNEQAMKDAEFNLELTGG